MITQRTYEKYKKICHEYEQHLVEEYKKEEAFFIHNLDMSVRLYNRVKLFLSIKFPEYEEQSYSIKLLTNCKISEFYYIKGFGKIRGFGKKVERELRELLTENNIPFTE